MGAKCVFNFCLLLCCFFSVGISGQTTLIDSLEATLPDAAPDTSRVILLCDLAFHLHNLKPDKAIAYAEEALGLTQKLGFKKGEANAIYKIGIAKMTLGEYASAINKVQEALEIAKEINYTKYVENCNNVLGLLYGEIGDIDKALSALYASVESAIQSRDTANIATGYLNIGKLLIVNDDHEKAKKYLLDAAELFRATNNLPYLSFSYNSLSVAEPDPERKEEYILKAIEIAEATESPYFASYAYGNYGAIIYKYKNNFEKAETYYLKSLEAGAASGDVLLLANASYEIAQIYQGEQYWGKARYYLEKCLEYAKPGTMDMMRRDVLRTLAANYLAVGQTQKAYGYLEESTVLGDSIQLRERDKLLTNADARFQVSQKEALLVEQQLELARQKNRQNRLTIGALVVLIVTAGLFQYFFYRQKRKKKEVELALESQQAEAEQLRRLDEMKTSFFTNVSHELRTPLTLIISPLEEALRQLKQVGLEDNLRLAHRNSKNLLNLVNEVLDLSKLEVGRLEVNRTEVDLLPYLRRIFFSFQSGADLKNIKLDFQPDLPATSVLHTDTVKLEKVLNNLIGNALKFTPNEGRIRLTAAISEQAPTNIQIRVSDTGPGIHPDDLPHIFGRFFQSKKGHRQLEGGTGIGLALAHQLTELMGGILTVDSEWGKGSVFTITIPGVQQRESIYSRVEEIKTESDQPNKTRPQEVSPAFVPNLINGQKARLLIVEDNPEMSRYLAASLRHSYHCTIAPDGEAALKTLEEQSFDLITSDVMMPNMDGFTLRERINQRPDWQRIPFILLTARTLEEDKLKGFRLGVDDYVTKPFSLPELQARIHNLLQNRTRREQWLAEEATADEEAQAALAPDEQLLQDAEKLVLDSLDDPQFSVTVMAKKLGYSSRHLSRVLGKLTGLSPVQFILELRLQKARQLLESRRFTTVSEVRYEIGIESASYFTKKFTERFGKNPREYLE